MSRLDSKQRWSWSSAASCLLCCSPLSFFGSLEVPFEPKLAAMMPLLRSLFPVTAALIVFASFSPYYSSLVGETFVSSLARASKRKWLWGHGDFAVPIISCLCQLLANQPGRSCDGSAPSKYPPRNPRADERY
jgi:hypothetical protein